MTPLEVSGRCSEVLGAIDRVIVGKDRELRVVLAALLAHGHVLIEDFPGLAKTLIASLLGEALGLGFRRIQFTPDLLPADVTGSFLYDQRSGAFEFRRGPLFTHLLLADEINRATPKTQSALLEGMQERQVTAEGETFPLESPFLVIATQNPVELEGTYPLPEAQLDRFLARVALGYPGREEERSILRRRIERRTDVASVPRVVTRGEFLSMQESLEHVHVEETIDAYVVDLARATREDARVTLGVSPRGTLALMKLSRAWAVLQGRDFVIPDDVKGMAVSAFAHRVGLKPELWVHNVSATEVIGDVLRQVPAPSAEAA
jgi:MoxR-like ATPase